MKRILVMIGAAMFVATGANALTINVDTDKQTYAVGELVTITATAVFAGSGGTDEKINPLQGLALQIGWDSSVAHVDNIPAGSGYGTSHQDITVHGGPGSHTGQPAITIGAYDGTTAYRVLGAPLNPACTITGYTCTILTQTHTGSAPGYTYSGYANSQTLVGTLVLRADAIGSLGLVQSAWLQSFGGMQMILPTYGANFGVAAVVVPEPGELLLLVAGVAGMLALGRRKS